MKASGLLVFAVLNASVAFAEAPVRVLQTRSAMSISSEPEMVKLVKAAFDVDNYREVRVQPIHAMNGDIHHLLVYLFAKTTHRVDFGAIFVNSSLHVTDVDRAYLLQQEDFFDQPGALDTPTCPDPATQFIAFAPNQITTEQQVTVDVANAAIAKGLKTVQLLTTNATRVNYMNYLSCPNLKGNFYDGDSNPNEFITVDGVISSDDVKQMRFNYSVTNIWLACEAFNDPMKSAVIDDAETQKYAAGINDLQIGPSDNTGKCAMIAGINGAAMTKAFNDCYNQYDVSGDKWGFDGKGSDYFGR